MQFSQNQGVITKDVNNAAGYVVDAKPGRQAEMMKMSSLTQMSLKQTKKVGQTYPRTITLMLQVRMASTMYLR